ncbi:hypothetical protein ACIQVA_36765 [Streptomyces microflavus]|uniref:hypothetical protein n=1 Tax=Streptomyces microflavus TaxID=1919 RepID=UPI0038184BB4
MADEQAAPEAVDLGEIQGSEDSTTDGIQQVPAQIQARESPTVAVARERLVEAIGREAVFLADQRAGQAAEGLETLARAFALVANPGSVAALAPAAIGKRDVGQMGYDAYQEYNAPVAAKSRPLPVNQDTIAQRETVELTGR